jgi:hypothetical protein
MRGTSAASVSFFDQDAEAARQSLYSPSSAAKALSETVKSKDFQGQVIAKDRHTIWPE